MFSCWVKVLWGKLEKKGEGKVIHFAMRKVKEKLREDFPLLLGEFAAGKATQGSSFETTLLRCKEKTKGTEP